MCLTIEHGKKWGWRRWRCFSSSDIPVWICHQESASAFHLKNLFNLINSIIHFTPPFKSNPNGEFYISSKIIPIFRFYYHSFSVLSLTPCLSIILIELTLVCSCWGLNMMISASELTLTLCQKAINRSWWMTTSLTQFASVVVSCPLRTNPRKWRTLTHINYQVL